MCALFYVNNYSITAHFKNETGQKVGSLLFDNYQGRGDRWQESLMFKEVIDFGTTENFKNPRNVQYAVDIAGAECDQSCCTRISSDWFPIKEHVEYVLTIKNGQPFATPQAIKTTQSASKDRVITFINNTNQKIWNMTFDKVILPDKSKRSETIEARKRFRNKNGDGENVELTTKGSRGTIKLDGNFINSNKFRFQLYPSTCNKPECCEVIGSEKYAIQNNHLYTLKIQDGKPIMIVSDYKH